MHEVMYPWQNLLFGICGLGHFDPKKEPWKSTQVDKEVDFDARGTHGANDASLGENRTTTQYRGRQWP